MTWRRAGVAGAAGCLVVEAASGLWLTFHYRPGVDGWIRIVHRLVAVLFIGLVVIAIAAAVVVAVRRRPGAPVVSGFAVMLAVASLTAVLSGAALAWDQLALRAVTVNSSYAGVWRAAYSAGVRFVLIGRFEVTQAEYRVAVVAHLFAAPAIVLVALAALSRSGPSPPLSGGTRPPSPASRAGGPRSR